MRTRALSTTGDFQFGRGGIFLIDSPEAVAQVVMTRLNLWAGEWFLDLSEGTPYNEILGYGSDTTRDLLMKDRILSSPGVEEILLYSSSVVDRVWTVNATLSTIYGNTSINIQL